MGIYLKHNQTADTAIEQINDKRYPNKIAEHTGEILLVEIADGDDKGYTCLI